MLMKQTDELENFVSEKINVIENLIESTKKSISQIQLMQYEAVNGGNRDINDASFVSSRRISSVNPSFSQNTSLLHDACLSRRKRSTIKKPPFTSQNTSLLHDVGLSRRKKSTINKPPFVNQNTFLPHRENLTSRP